MFFIYTQNKVIYKDNVPLPDTYTVFMADVTAILYAWEYLDKKSLKNA